MTSKVEKLEFDVKILFKCRQNMDAIRGNGSDDGDRELAAEWSERAP